MEALVFSLRAADPAHPPSLPPALGPLAPCPPAAVKLNANRHVTGVLRGFDLAVKPGERVGLVGHSGAGKTTAVNLLLRFHDLFRDFLRDELERREPGQAAELHARAAAVETRAERAVPHWLAAGRWAEAKRLP